MKLRRIPPFVYIVLSFLGVIVIGTLLFLLPISTNHAGDLSLVDAFFLATSAVCVTGLSPVPSLAATLSLFGKVVLTILIQIGGLGFLTFVTFLLVLVGAKIGISNRFLIKESLNQFSAGGVIRLVKTIIKVTAAIELFGTALNFIVFIQDYSFFEALGLSFFHAISSFNNAGFDLLGSSSLIAYKDDILLNFSTMILVFLGGIGFIVIQDILIKKRFKKLNAHSKIVLLVSSLLILSGALIIKLFEGSNISFLQALFQSVTLRTAGFSTVDQASLGNATILLCLLFMIIGASPSSTGGGIKTTTFYVMAKSITSFARGKATLVKSRKITEELKLKAFTLTSIALFSIIVITAIISAIEASNTQYVPSLRALLFEVTSAFGTVGLSLNITSYLYDGSKILLCVMMFLGRLGPLTILNLWNRNWNKPNANDIDFLPEKIIIG